MWRCFGWQTFAADVGDADVDAAAADAAAALEADHEPNSFVAVDVTLMLMRTKMMRRRRMTTRNWRLARNSHLGHLESRLGA